MEIEASDSGESDLLKGLRFEDQVGGGGAIADTIEAELHIFAKSEGADQIIGAKAIGVIVDRWEKHLCSGDRLFAVSSLTNLNPINRASIIINDK